MWYIRINSNYFYYKVLKNLNIIGINKVVKKVYYDLKTETTKNKINKKKIVNLICILMLIILIIATTAAYIVNENIREYIDFHLLNKEVQTDELMDIPLAGEKNSYVCSYDGKIAILNNNILKVYNDLAEEKYQLDVNITIPIFASNNKNLVIAEKSGKKVYYISGKNIVWQAEVDGEIQKINVNKNGYTTIIVSQSTYKTVVITYNPQGEELFKTFISNAYAIDTDISNDNKYLIIAEVITEGIQVRSNIRFVSLDKVGTDTDNSIVEQKTSDSNRMITAINYNDAKQLIAMYDNSIDVIEEETEEKLVEFNQESLFASVNLNREIVEVNQKNNNENISECDVLIIDSTNQSKKVYTIDAIPKNINARDSTIAINTGAQAYFIGVNGWLKKKCVSNQEIKEIVLGDGIAGIVYNNKISILKI